MAGFAVGVPLRPLIALTSLVALWLVGCNATGSPPSGDDPGFEALADKYLQEARAGGASGDQVALILDAQRNGEVSLEVMRAATYATVDCALTGGLDAEYTELVSADGWITPGVTYSYATGTIDEDVVDGLVAACETLEFEWIFKFYETQPRAVEASNTYLNTREGPLRACLESHGESTDQAATGTQLAAQALELLSESEGEINCLEESGVDVVR